MKIKLQLFIFFIAFSTLTKSQLYNNGATITIQNGGYLMVAGDLKNISGTILNEGKIEVQGNFINLGSYLSSGNEDSLIMSGPGTDTLTAGNAVINYLTINKTSGNDVIRLGGSAVVNTKLDYLSGVFTTDPISNPSYKLSSPISAIYNFASGTEIVGTVERTGWTNGTTRIFNQANMQVSTNDGTGPTTFTVTMIPQSEGGDPTQNEREVKRKFLFAQSGGSGFTANISFPYATAELNTNVEANLVPWKLISGEWNAEFAPVTHDIVNHFLSATALPPSDLAYEWKLADPKYTFNVTAFLYGAWNGSQMTTNLNSGGILPLSQPYNISPFNYAGSESVTGIPNGDVVDWVLVEHRKPLSGLPSDATSSTITGRKAGFLLRDGTIVDMDGATPLSFDITKQGAAFIVVRHRNHLGVLSNAISSNPTGTFANDFSVLANSYRLPSAPSDPMILLPGSSKYGLWAGDVNKNGTVNATDINEIKLAISGSQSGYLFTDINLSNSINVTDVNLAKATISSSGAGSAILVANGGSNVTIRTNIPDPIIE